MESLVGTSAKVPTTSRAIVDKGKLQELVDQLRLAIPTDVTAAQEILHRKESLYTQAQVEARNIKGEAEEQFRTKVNENELVKAARRRADDLVAEAQRKAQRLLEQANTEAKARRTEADAYAGDVLRNLDKQLTSLLSTVRRGMEVLH
jgi:cell division septum initiation protein DivIVA